MGELCSICVLHDYIKHRLMIFQMLITSAYGLKMEGKQYTSLGVQ